MVRYSLLRILIFFGFLTLFWLIGLRDNPVLLLAAAALASAALSYVLLRGMRDEITAGLVERRLLGLHPGIVPLDEAGGDLVTQAAEQDV